MKPLKFKGVYKDYIWGGNKMRSKYGVQTDLDVVAESWVLSCHKDGMSVIDGGEYDGVSLDKYIAQNPAVLGTDCKWKELPILIKFIDIWIWSWSSDFSNILIERDKIGSLSYQRLNSAIYLLLDISNY